MHGIRVFTIFLLAQCSATMIIAETFNKPGLCDAEGIHAEILKAIEILKTKQGQPLPALNKTRITAGVGTVRQDGDDDDDIPYYVPAIAKVIGSVLAQNATSVIEESFGFIPPEVNKNIRYVLSLVAETVQNLKPMMSTTTSIPVKKVVQEQPIPIPSSSPEENRNITEQEQVTQIEAFLAYALAQEIGASIGANVSAFPLPGSMDPYPYFVEEKNELVTPKPLMEEVHHSSPPEPVLPELQPVESIPELFSSTFKYFDVQAVNSDRVSSEGGLAIYAPNYAPNYLATTTTEKIPVYASAYDHLSYMVSPPSTTPSPLKLVVTKNATTTTEGGETEEIATTSETSLSTTTEDDDDDYEDSDN